MTPIVAGARSDFLVLCLFDFPANIPLDARASSHVLNEDTLNPNRISNFMAELRSAEKCVNCHNRSVWPVLPYIAS